MPYPLAICCRTRDGWFATDGHPLVIVGAAGGTKDAFVYVDVALFDGGDAAATIEQATNDANIASLVVKFISIIYLYVDICYVTLRYQLLYESFQCHFLQLKGEGWGLWLKLGSDMEKRFGR